MNRARLDQGCRWGIAGLLLAALLWGPLGNGGRTQGAFLVLLGLVLAAGVLWGARLWISPEPRLLFPAIGWPVLLFTAYAVIRYLTTDLEYPARQELLKILVYALMFFLALNHLHRHKPANFLLLALIFMACLVAGIAFYQFVTKAPRVWMFAQPVVYRGRGSGTFTCPDHLAGFLEMLLPLALAMVFWGKHKVLTKVFLCYAAIWLLVGIAITLSRGGWVATLVGLGVFSLALLAQRRFRLWAAIAIALVVLAGVVFEMKTGAIQKRFNRDNPEDFNQQLAVRLNMWRSALDVWRDHAWWGAGPGLYDEKFRPYRPPRLQGRPLYAHNEYVQALADWGLAGTALLAAALVLFFLTLVKHWNHKVFRTEHEYGERNSSYPLVIGASAAVIAILAHCFVDFHFHVPGNALLALTLMAIVVSQAEGVPSRWRLSLGLPGRAAVTLVLLPMLLFLGWQLRTGWHEWQWLERAADAKRDLPQRRDALLQAHQADPANPLTAYLVGETYRRLSLAGSTNYEALAIEAIKWFDRGGQLNPYDPFYPLSKGLCLDWLKRPDEALACFQKAAQLDPNNVAVVNYLAWHYVQIRDYPRAKAIFLQAIKLKYDDPFAHAYLRITEERLKDPLFAP